MKKLNNKGFSLVELIVVIAIMAILVGVLAPSVLGQLDKANQAKDKQAVDSVATACAMAFADPDLTGKPATGTDPVSSAGISWDFSGGANVAAAGVAAPTTYTQVVQNTVGYTTIAFVSDAFKGGSITSSINTTTGKITIDVTLADGTTWTCAK